MEQDKELEQPEREITFDETYDYAENIPCTCDVCGKWRILDHTELINDVVKNICTDCI